MKNLMIIILIIFYSSHSMAGIFVKTSGAYIVDSDESSETNSTETTDTFLDASLGWMSSKGWSIGATLATHSEATTTTTSLSTSESTVEKSSNGITLGWVNHKPNGFFALGSYFLNSEITSGQSNQTTTYTGSGYQLEFGYKATIKRIGFGAQLTYKSLSYDSYTVGNNTTTLSSPLVYTDIVPMVNIWLIFI